MSDRPRERARRPRPLLAHRVASGRGATEQPNAGGAATDLSVRLWLLVALTGVGAGGCGIACTSLLDGVARLAFGPVPGGADGFGAAVAATPVTRRVLVVAGAGVLVGLAGPLLRRLAPGRDTGVEDAVWRGDTALPLRRSLGTAALTEIVIGMGASLGREAPPRLLGGVCGSLAGRRGGLGPDATRLLVACGAGAGLGCVYDAPLAGALFTAEVLVGTLGLSVVLPALACSGLATVVTRLRWPARIAYPPPPAHPIGASALVWAVLAGPVLGVLAVALVRLLAGAAHHRPTGRAAVGAGVGAFAVLGALGAVAPELLGNGQNLAADAFLGRGTLLTLAAVALLKPLVTALCLGGGAPGGLLTPTLSTGAALGGALGAAWSLAWPGTPVGAYAVIGAAAFLGAAMQAPLTGLVLVPELLGGGFGLLAPLVVTTTLATGVARYLDGYSLYSARLPAR